VSTLSPADTCVSGLEWRHERTLRLRSEEKLAFLEEFNQLLVESSGDCVLVVDADGRVISINKTGRELFELKTDNDGLNRPWTALFKGLETKPPLVLSRLPQHGATFHAISKTASGEPRYWSILSRSFGGAVGAGRFLVIARDITQHMLIGKALRQSEEAFRKIFEENPIGIILAGLDCQITKVNSALGAMLGFLESELLGRDLRNLPDPPDEQHAFNIERLLHREIGSFQSEVVFRTKRKQPVWSHITTSVLHDTDGVPTAMFQMVENIQDRKTTEEQVLAYQQQLQTLASELALGEERERRRIATNLHDRIGQSLAFARLKLAALNKEKDGVSEVRELIDQAIADTRSLTFELSPPVLYELGLVAAIEWLTRKFQQEHRIQTRFHDDEQPKPVHENFRVVLFQSVRELLVNVVKHAKASHAQVLLRRDADALRIIIEDDGVGFEVPGMSARREPARSFGLFNIRERVEYLGGHVNIRSELGQGTRVTLIAPLKIEQGVDS
jgi:PAS domain S-box-containing protein